MKIERKRISDAILDGFILVLLGFLFSGTIAGLMIGTIASAIVSLYLMISPPKEFFTPKGKEKYKSLNIQSILKNKETRSIQ
jgi:Zn-dependent membrane protease YugP